MKNDDNRQRNVLWVAVFALGVVLVVLVLSNDPSQMLRDLTNHHPKIVLELTGK